MSKKHKKKLSATKLIGICVVFAMIVVAIVYFYFNTYLPIKEIKQIQNEIAGKTFEESVSVCEQKTEKLKNNCLVIVANHDTNETRLMNGSACWYITNTSFRDGCLLVMAAKTSNIDICNKMASDEVKTRCIDFVSNTLPEIYNSTKE